MTTQTKLALAGFIIFIVAYVIGNAVGHADNSQTVDQHPVAVHATPEATAAATPATTAAASDPYETAYVGGCSKDGQHASYCHCTYRYLINTYGLQELLTLGQQPDASSSPEMLSAAKACYSLY